MPVPHFNIKITQRSKGKSAVAGAAYQAGEKLFSEYDQKTKNYTCKKEVVYTEIMLPPNVAGVVDSEDYQLIREDYSRQYDGLRAALQEAESKKTEVERQIEEWFYLLSCSFPEMY